MTLRALALLSLACAGLTVGAPRLAHGQTAPARARAGAVRGRVTDDRGAGIADVEVVLAESGRRTRTGADGSFALAKVPAGHHTVVIHRTGYAAVTREIEVTGEEAALEVALTPTPFAVDPVEVTAARKPQPALDSPIPMAALEGDDLELVTGISVAHALDGLPGVRVVSTGDQIGKPMIRGLTGSRVLVLDDGHRMEDYSWSDEDGPSIDPTFAERIEVIRGPASVQYGSDAIGGVANAIARDLPTAAEGEGFTRARTGAYFGSNSREFGANLSLEGARGGVGWMIAGTGRTSEAMHSPDGEIEHTGFGAFTGEAAIGTQAPGHDYTFRYARYGGEFKLLEAGGPPPGVEEGEEEGPERKSSDDRFQFDAGLVGGAIRYEARLQWQRHSLIELSDEFLPPDSTSGRWIGPGPSLSEEKEVEAFNLLLNTGTVDLLAHHQLGDRVYGTAGISGLHQNNDTRGPIPLVPDATVSSAAAFVYEEWRMGAWSVLGGVRGDGRWVSADQNATLGFDGDERRDGEFSGSAGVVFRPMEPVAVTANLGRAWRAPTLFELYANGPQVAEARYLVGRDDLNAERGLDLDLGVRWEQPRHRGELALYRNAIEDFVYLQPTADSLSSLQVWRYEQADAVLTGLEASEGGEIFPSIWLSGRVDLVEGERSSDDEPLPLIPPLRGVVGLEGVWSHLSWANRFRAGVELEMVEEKDRAVDNEIATAGYVLLHGDVGLERQFWGRAWDFSFRGRNLGNASYRDFLSRYKAFALNPGRNLVFKVETNF